MPPVSLELDDYDLHDFAALASTFGYEKYAYVVTPNADHIIRFHDDANFRDLYRQAAYVLLDSRFLANIIRRTHRINARVCAGSDLTAKLFNDVILPTDTLVLIGGTDTQAQKLREKYQLQDLRHYNPPMGFIKNATQVETCLQYIESNSPFRFCLLAVGCPQQETVAQQLKARGRTKGMALCIGASVNFLTGDERRAPAWVQKLSCEWAYRLLQDPKRLAKRYLVRGPRIFALLRKLDIRIRPSSSLTT
jgi:exopolysaccharide biosynthesis WecB/TagA/CpsF family protein